LLLVGPDLGPSGAVRAAVERSGAQVVGRLIDVDDVTEVGDPQVVVVDVSVMERDEAGAAVAKAVVRWPLAGVVAVVTAPGAALVRALLAAGARAVLSAVVRGGGLVDVDLVRPAIELNASVLAEARRRDRALVEALAAAAETGGPAPAAGLRRTVRLATELASLVDPELARREDLTLGGLLHDVGNVAVPRHILATPGPLDEADLRAVRRHPEAGAMIVAPLGLPRTVTEVVLLHHERWDGGGYPMGRAGRETPLAARLFALADALAAMTAPRPHRAALPTRTALERIRDEAGRQFDPELVTVLLGAVAAGELDLDDPVGVDPDLADGPRFARERVVGSGR
jgi:hypothetical protein